MPSSWTPSIRLEMQFSGENVNLWGDKLNTALLRVDSSVAGWSTVALTGNYSLSVSNTAADEARSAMLKFTGTGSYTVTIPSVSKRYDVWNALTGDATITTGAGSTVTLLSGEVASVICDGSNVKRVGFYTMQSQRLREVADPTSAQDAATRNYVDTAISAAAYSAGTFGVAIIPADSGKILTNNGSTPSWTSTLTTLTVTGALTAGSLSVGAITASGALATTGSVTIGAGVTLTGSTKQNVQAVASTSIDLSASDFFTKSISSNTTFSFASATASVGQGFVLDLTISSAAVPSWPASVKWADGVNPSSTLGNGRHVLGFLTTDGGTTWVGFVAASAVA